ncbi:MAG: hypothetical protein ISF22_00995 [Methanomassiliicoccus sp.]|nr:hypothetical protein [Methanomassiliicoccus sp.]
MDRRTRGGRAYRRKDFRDLEHRLARLEARVERLERGERPRAEVKETVTCCDDIIGCLDDCVTDVREIRKRVRDVRS